MKNTTIKICAVVFGLICIHQAAFADDKNAGENKTNNTPASKKYNILFVPVDDLRPELGAYGNKIIKSPHIDAMAANGVVFNRAYCQQAVCNPSRASLLTGLRPDTLKVWDLQTDLRAEVPDIVTLPQFFKNHGYKTLGIGKTFHNNIPDSTSWDNHYHLPGYPFDADAIYADEKNLQIQQARIEKQKAEGRQPDPLGMYYTKAESYEHPDVADDAYYDAVQTTRAIELLKELKNGDQPFFLSVGFYKPHLPLNAPDKYWRLYKDEDIPLAPNQYVPKGSPGYAVHGSQELRNYIDQHDTPFPEDKPFSAERQRELVHAYYACVSYIDAQIGRLTKALDDLGLAENTIIVLWGDHGWKLGEHNAWCKQSNYEVDTRVPLIVSGAGVTAKGKTTNALTEFVDIYPSLLEMCGFEVPGYLQGSSFVPLLNHPGQQWKNAAYSQFLLGRFGKQERIPGEIMGYAVRTNDYRYVEWYAWDKSTNSATTLMSRELFDENKDPGENLNLANDPAHQLKVNSLHRLLGSQFKQVK